MRRRLRSGEPEADGESFAVEFVGDGACEEDDGYCLDDHYDSGVDEATGGAVG